MYLVDQPVKNLNKFVVDLGFELFLSALLVEYIVQRMSLVRNSTFFSNNQQLS